MSNLSSTRKNHHLVNLSLLSKVYPIFASQVSDSIFLLTPKDENYQLVTLLVKISINGKLKKKLSVCFSLNIDNNNVN